MTFGRRTLVAAALCGVLGVGACAQPVTEAVPTGWRQVEDGPLGPREQALGLWTGREVLLIGGSDARPCPPNASCVSGPSALRDAAALDPGTGRWRTLAAPPIPVLGTQGVVIGTTAYVQPYEPRGVLLVYRVDDDSWTRQEVPFGDYQLTAAGDRLVAYRGGDEAGSGPDYVLEAGKWTALPDDPLGDAFDRHLAWSGRELVLFDHDLVPSPNGERPSLTRMAALDLGTRTWRRLPDAPMLSTGPWLLADGKLVNPALGGADGGQVDNWGRTYPNGGTVDSVSGAFSPLPDPPGGKDAVGGGARTEGAALYSGPADSVLDIATRTWQRLPELPGGDRHGHTVVTAGVSLVVSGGTRQGKLLGSTWVWTPGQ